MHPFSTSTKSITMQADKDKIQHALSVLFEPNDTVELRCVGNRIIGGFYRDVNKLVDDAFALNTTFNPLENCYIGINPCLPELFGRRADQFAICGKGEAVKDQEILCRRWLLIDVDANRPKGVSATDAQKSAAIEIAKQVYAWLQNQLGSTCLVCADSGNGAHILIRLPDVPNDNQTKWVCETAGTPGRAVQKRSRKS